MRTLTVVRSLVFAMIAASAPFAAAGEDSASNDAPIAESLSIRDLERANDLLHGRPVEYPAALRDPSEGGFAPRVDFDEVQRNVEQINRSLAQYEAATAAQRQRQSGSLLKLGFGIALLVVAGLCRLAARPRVRRQPVSPHRDPNLEIAEQMRALDRLA